MNSYVAIHNLYFYCHTNIEVINVDKKEQEQQNRQKNLNKFNNITEKVKPENQNQNHNARKEAVDVKLRQV